jgi:predicted N-formylglutamate amidohydrolase
MHGSGRPPEAPFVEHAHPEGRASALLLCDHAGCEVPPELGDLGLGEADLARHIGWDIGAADVTRRLARILDAPALLNHCSRLVIDPNRRPRTPTSIPIVSDGTLISGNASVPPCKVLRRIRRCFLPYHRAVARRIASFRRGGVVPVVIAVHSLTPRMNGQNRPWQVGILWRADRRLSVDVLSGLRGHADVCVSENQPYSGIDEFGFTVEFHAQRGRLPHLMIELRQDEITTTTAAERYAKILGEALQKPLGDPRLYSLFAGPLIDGQPWRKPRGLMSLR